MPSRPCTALTVVVQVGPPATSERTRQPGTTGAFTVSMDPQQILCGLHACVCCCRARCRGTPRTRPVASGQRFESRALRSRLLGGRPVLRHHGAVQCSPPPFAARCSVVHSRTGFVRTAGLQALRPQEGRARRARLVPAAAVRPGLRRSRSRLRMPLMVGTQVTRPPTDSPSPQATADRAAPRCRQHGAGSCAAACTNRGGSHFDPAEHDRERPSADVCTRQPTRARASVDSASALVLGVQQFQVLAQRVRRRGQEVSRVRRHARSQAGAPGRVGPPACGPSARPGRANG